jgi:hypothetical protein
VPAGLRVFLIALGLAAIGLFVGAGLAIGATQDDPGSGAFRFDYGRQTVTGVLELHPYPLLSVTEGSKRITAGHTLMLSGSGKRGLGKRAAGLDGQLVEVSGVLLARGDLDMLQVRGGKKGLVAVDGDAPPLETQPLGRWRLTGEICDGKCLAGAMRPGRGLAHKACANLCLIGGVPPVFVSSQAVEGSEFLMIAGADGAALPAAAYDHVGQFLSLEGNIEQRGDVLVFSVDLNSLELL